MGRFVYSVFSEHYRFIGGKVALFYGMFFLFNVTLLWFVTAYFRVSSPSLTHKMAGFIFNVEV
jgi:hypothetical protein